VHAQAAAASCLSLWIGDGEGGGNGHVRVPGLHDVGDERRGVVSGGRELAEDGNVTMVPTSRTVGTSVGFTRSTAWYCVRFYSLVVETIQ
jgi:hypothetical protein